MLGERVYALWCVNVCMLVSACMPKLEIPCPRTVECVQLALDDCGEEAEASTQTKISHYFDKEAKASGSGSGPGPEPVSRPVTSLFAGLPTMGSASLALIASLRGKKRPWSPTEDRDDELLRVLSESRRQEQAELQRRRSGGSSSHGDEEDALARALANSLDGSRERGRGGGRGGRSFGSGEDRQRSGGGGGRGGNRRSTTSRR